MREGSGATTTTGSKTALLGGSLDDFHIPAFLLSDVGPKPDSAAGLADAPGCSPVLAFINPKSGDGISKRLGAVLRIQLGSGQVYDLTQHNPESVLRALHERLMELCRRANPAAEVVAKSLVVLVAGGDGSLSWVLKAVRETWGEGAGGGGEVCGAPPPVLPVPLGTGNDLARAMGWGGGVRRHELNDVTNRVRVGRAAKVDAWKVSIREEAFVARSVSHDEAGAHSDGDERLLSSGGGSAAPVRSGEVPRRAASYPFTMQQAAEGEIGEGAAGALVGQFWNYFSVGMDAAAAQGFLAWRERYPWTTGGLTRNAIWYTAFACLNGGWCFDGVVPRLAPFVTLHVRSTPTAEWSTVPVPSTCRSIVLVNLGSYGAGRDLWGKVRARARAVRAKAHRAKERVKNSVRKGLGKPPRSDSKRAAAVDSPASTPVFADGRIEVVGLRNGWHGAAIMAGAMHGMRLAQACAVRIELSEQNPVGETYLQVDGDAWIQPLPARGSRESLVIDIAHIGCGRVVLNPL